MRLFSTNTKQVPAIDRKGIMIVDDSRFSRNVLRDILKNEGYEVVGEAEDGLKAVELAKELKPEIVFLDVEMPKLDGIGTIPRLLEVDPGIIIIMCTALGQKKLIVEATKAGARDYVIKPYKRENIVSVLQVLMPKREEKESPVQPTDKYAFNEPSGDYNNIVKNINKYKEEKQKTYYSDSLHIPNQKDNLNVSYQNRSSYVPGQRDNINVSYQNKDLHTANQRADYNTQYAGGISQTPNQKANVNTSYQSGILHTTTTGTNVNTSYPGGILRTPTQRANLNAPYNNGLNTANQGEGLNTSYRGRPYNESTSMSGQRDEGVAYNTGNKEPEKIKSFNYQAEGTKGNADVNVIGREGTTVEGNGKAAFNGIVNGITGRERGASVTAAEEFKGQTTIGNPAANFEKSQDIPERNKEKSAEEISVVKNDNRSAEVETLKETQKEQAIDKGTGNKEDKHEIAETASEKQDKGEIKEEEIKQERNIEAEKTSPVNGAVSSAGVKKASEYPEQEKNKGDNKKDAPISEKTLYNSKDFSSGLADRFKNEDISLISPVKYRMSFQKDREKDPVRQVRFLGMMKAYITLDNRFQVMLFNSPDIKMLPQNIGVRKPIQEMLEDKKSTVEDYTMAEMLKVPESDYYRLNEQKENDNVILDVINEVVSSKKLRMFGDFKSL